MKKNLLLFLFAITAIIAKAQSTPLITLTAEVDGSARTFEFADNSADVNDITVDWGDGVIKEGVSINATYDGFTPAAVTGTPVGTGKIKIYSNANLSYFDCISKVDGPGITELDVTKATQLKELYANGNKLTTIDLSKNTVLEKVYLNNNQLTTVTLTSSITYLNLQKNQLTEFNTADVPNVVTLYLTENTIKSLDLSKCPSLKSGYFLNCGLESATIGENVSVKTILNFNNNKLSTLDVTGAPGLSTGSLFLMKNNLTELKYNAIKTLNVSGNKFNLATLPTENVTTLTYAPQQPMEITATGSIVDLSDQNMVKGFASEPKYTIFTWYTASETKLMAGTDYSEDSGVFTFLKEQSEPIYCTMQTEAFPKFTGTNIFKTTEANVTLSSGATLPLIILTAEVDGSARTFEFADNSADVNDITIDWGDGVIKEGVSINATYDGFTTAAVTGTPVGTGKIKIYSNANLSYFDCISKVDGPGITELDVTKATQLKELYANGNKLTTIDLSKNTVLEKVYLNNNQLTTVTLTSSITYLNLEKNQLTEFNTADVPNVVTLYLTENTIKSLDLSKCPSLKSGYFLNCGLESATIGENVSVKTILSFNNNKLSTLDVTGAPGLSTGSLFLKDNNLTELKYNAIKTLNVSGNKFNLATLPTENVTTLTYAPQQPMEITATGSIVDLSDQNKVKGVASEPKYTIFTWYTSTGNKLMGGTDYKEENGLFTFLKQQTEPVYCTMQTDAFPKFTGSNIFKTAEVTVLLPTSIENVELLKNEKITVYSVNGQLVGRDMDIKTLNKGVYVIRRANKATKIVIN